MVKGELTSFGDLAGFGVAGGMGAIEELVN